jgi:hypothetical protein
VLQLRATTEREAQQWLEVLAKCMFSIRNHATAAAVRRVRRAVARGEVGHQKRTHWARSYLPAILGGAKPARASPTQRASPTKHPPPVVDSAVGWRSCLFGKPAARKTKQRSLVKLSLRWSSLLLLVVFVAFFTRPMYRMFADLEQFGDECDGFNKTIHVPRLDDDRNFTQTRSVSLLLFSSSSPLCFHLLFRTVLASALGRTISFGCGIASFEKRRCVTRQTIWSERGGRGEE